MKAGRRHELQHNVLDAELGKLLDFFKRYGTYIAWGVLIAALIALIAVYTRNKRSTARMDVQVRFGRAVTDRTLKPDDRLAELKALSEQDTDGQVAAQACLAVADEYAARLISMTAAMPAAEKTRFHDQAKTYYQRALQRFGDRATVVGRAHIGLARLAESMRDFSTARSEYEAVRSRKDLAATDAGILAEKALADLERVSRPVQMASTAPALKEEEKAEKKDPAPKKR